MKKNDFMQRLSDELQKRNVADAADILQEYEAHFAMKMADGYIEEEIAARLGDPTALAAQFDDAEETPEKKGRQQAAGGGRAVLCGRVCGAVFHPAGRLRAGAGRHPLCLHGLCYLCVSLSGSAPVALGRERRHLRGHGCTQRLLLRSYGRFRKNALASASGEAGLPPLPISPQFSPKARRRLRTVALVALALFAVCFVLAYFVCSLSAGSVQFWHAWGWFAK